MKAAADDWNGRSATTPDRDDQLRHLPRLRMGARRALLASDRGGSLSERLQQRRQHARPHQLLLQRHERLDLSRRRLGAGRRRQHRLRDGLRARAHLLHGLEGLDRRDPRPAHPPAGRSRSVLRSSDPVQPSRGDDRQRRHVGPPREVVRLRAQRRHLQHRAGRRAVHAEPVRGAAARVRRDGRRVVRGAGSEHRRDAAPPRRRAVHREPVRRRVLGALRPRHVSRPRALRDVARAPRGLHARRDGRLRHAQRPPLRAEGLSREPRRRLARAHRRVCGRPDASGDLGRPQPPSHLRALALPRHRPGAQGPRRLLHARSARERADSPRADPRRLPRRARHGRDGRSAAGRDAARLHDRGGRGARHHRRRAGRAPVVSREPGHAAQHRDRPRELLARRRAGRSGEARRAHRRVSQLGRLGDPDAHVRGRRRPSGRRPSSRSSPSPTTPGATTSTT